MAPVYIGLVHYPIYNKHMEVVTTALTNYDLHDIARTAKTYGVRTYFIIHPIESQREMALRIMTHWKTGGGVHYNPNRKEAFEETALVPSLEDATRQIEKDCGEKPIIVTTDARVYPNTVSYTDMRKKIHEEEKPVFILFGTGFGMTREMMKQFDYIVEPIYGAGSYNHLCVRSAAAIILDRLLGEPWWNTKEGEIIMSGHSKWENIKRKKGKTDAIRAKITTKISKEITIAARMGGGDPVGNMRLKLALTKAKQNNVPKDNIQRAIAKGVGAASGAGFDEITYEGYGPGGAAVIVECNTDNRNRAAADVRHAFTHHGGSIGTPGCVAWMFKKKGIIVVSKEAADEDTLMMIALDAGAEDVSTDGDSFEITTAPEDFLTVSEALEKEGIAVEASEVTMVPDNTVSLEGDAADVMNKLTSELEELDDVQDVYTNAELPEDME